MRYQFRVLLEWDPNEDVWVTYMPALNYLSTWDDTVNGRPSSK